MVFDSLTRKVNGKMILVRKINLNLAFFVNYLFRVVFLGMIITLVDLGHHFTKYIRSNSDMTTPVHSDNFNETILQW